MPEIGQLLPVVGDADRIRNAVQLSHETGFLKATRGHRKAGSFLGSGEYLSAAACPGIHAVTEEKTLVHGGEEQRTKLKEVVNAGIAKLGSARRYDTRVDTASD